MSTFPASLRNLLLLFYFFIGRTIGHVLPPGGEAGDARGRYEADLEGLSADSWRQRFAGDEED